MLSLQVTTDGVSFWVNIHAVFVHVAHTIGVATSIINVCKTPAQLPDGAPLCHTLDGLIILTYVEPLGYCPYSSSCSINLRY